MTKSKVFFIVIILLAMIGVLEMNKIKPERRERDYVVTETGMPTSLDPLDSDATQNLSVARMLYGTPLEISLENELTSSLLEDFKYTPQSREIRWKVREGVEFSDGTPISPEDVAFSVSRMAYTRPKFPVLENIVGLAEWLKEPSPLQSFPKGITISGNEIVIKLDKSLQHPLFRFCLELFSVIPKKCVDPKSNKINCEKIPSSGPYEIAKREDAEIKFKLRSGYKSKGLPDIINFKYIPATQIVEKLTELPEHAVVAANEAMLSANDFAEVTSKTNTKFLPAARMTLFLLSPKSEKFRNPSCRWAFAQDLRQEYSSIQKTNSLEASVFTKIIPGYLKNEELLSGSAQKVAPQFMESCRVAIKNSGIKWGYAKGEANEGFVLATQSVLQKYEIASSPKEYATRKELYNAFETGEVDLMTLGTGFWALDPVGDLKMLFTPNLHKILSHISQDSHLQKLIAEVDEVGTAAGLAKVNQYIYDQALFNVFGHVRRFYFSKGQAVLQEVPFAITSPAPWQVFNL